MPRYDVTVTINYGVSASSPRDARDTIDYIVKTRVPKGFPVDITAEIKNLDTQEVTLSALKPMEAKREKAAEADRKENKPHVPV